MAERGARGWWEFTAPRRTLTFELKLAPQAQQVINDDVEQAATAHPTSLAVVEKPILRLR